MHNLDDTGVIYGNYYLFLRAAPHLLNAPMMIISNQNYCPHLCLQNYVHISCSNTITINNPYLLYLVCNYMKIISLFMNKEYNTRTENLKIGNYSNIYFIYAGHWTSNMCISSLIVYMIVV